MLVYCFISVYPPYANHFKQCSLISGRGLFQRFLPEGPMFADYTKKARNGIKKDKAFFRDEKNISENKFQRESMANFKFA